MEKPKVTPELDLKILEVKEDIEVGKKLESSLPFLISSKRPKSDNEKVNAILENDTIRHGLLGMFIRATGLKIIEVDFNQFTSEKCNGSCELCVCKKSTNQGTKETSTAGQSE